jgi:hypothetical protein
MEEVPVYEEAPVYTDRQRRKPFLDGLSAVDLNWQHPEESNGAGGMCVEMAAVPAASRSGTRPIPT